MPLREPVPEGAVGSCALLAAKDNMNSDGKSWLDLYVDAMLEKDPYKRLALVRKLRSVPRQGESEDVVLDEVPLRRSSKAVRTGTSSRRR